MVFWVETSLKKTTFDENLNIHRWDPKYSTNVIIGKIFGMSENAEHPLLLFIVVIHLCSAFSDYTAANKKHADHSRIISKLPLYGMRDKELAWLESYLFGRTQFVQYDSYRSETQYISHVVFLRGQF